jgi:hypothetical protein
MSSNQSEVIQQYRTLLGSNKYPGGCSSAKQKQVSKALYPLTVSLRVDTVRFRVL